MGSRRWQPGELAFQGGTSLHLVHGSPRFSEDLDFLISGTLDVAKISEAVTKRVQSATWLPAGAKIMVKKAKDDSNPHAFAITAGGDDIIGSARVKVELWKTAPMVMRELTIQVSPVRSISGPLSGAQSFVPSLSLEEVFADKVFALVARPYLKPRDVFDLHWLQERHGIASTTADQMRQRLETYPGETLDQWLRKAVIRRQDLTEQVGQVEKDLRRWLPSSWSLTPELSRKMVDVAIEALDHGRVLMEQIKAQRELGKSDDASSDGTVEADRPAG